MNWAKATAIRAARTAAQTALGIIGSSMVLSQVDWLQVISGATLACIVSVLMSVTGLPEVSNAGN